MKRFLLPAVALLGLAAMPAIQLLASQNGAKVAALAIMKALSDAGWQVRDGAIDVLPQGGTKIYPATLYFGNQYKIVAAGDEEAADVDLGVYYGPDGKFLAKDTDESNVAVCNITPGYTDQFYFKVLMTRTKSGGSAHFILQYASKAK